MTLGVVTQRVSEIEGFWGWTLVGTLIVVILVMAYLIFLLLKEMFTNTEGK